VNKDNPVGSSTPDVPQGGLEENGTKAEANWSREKIFRLSPMYLELFVHHKFSTEPESFAPSRSSEILIKGAS